MWYCEPAGSRQLILKARGKGIFQSCVHRVKEFCQQLLTFCGLCCWLQGSTFAGCTTSMWQPLLARSWRLLKKSIEGIISFNYWCLQIWLICSIVLMEGRRVLADAWVNAVIKLTLNVGLSFTSGTSPWHQADHLSSSSASLWFSPNNLDENLRE